MKICLLLALVGLVIGFTVPALAQQKESTPDPQLRQQLVAFAKKYDEAFNNNDAAAAAALYTEDAVIVPETGPVNGRQAIEKWYADGLQKWHDSNHLVTVDQDSPHIIGTAGNQIWATGVWSTTIQGQNGGPIQLKGYWSAIYIREGDDWKIRMLTWNMAPPPAAPAQTK
jgi:ketosteroid isomerase-like protein